MKVPLSSTLLTAALFLNLSASGAEKTETLSLDNIATPKRWSPAESSVTLDTIKFSGKPVLKWVAPIDHFAGEKKYPVGWPRMYLTNFTRLKPAVPTDWRAWDYFEFDVKMRLEGQPENKTCPVTFIIISSPPNYYNTFRKLHDGKIHSVKIPVDRLKNPGRIVRMGFSISESNYKHGAKLTVQAGRFRLTRSALCTVDKVTMLTPAVTAADPAIKLQLHISGPAGDVARGVPFLLSCGKKKIRKETLPVQRGEKTVEVSIEELKLEPGNYTLTLFPDDKSRRKAVRFKVTSSPYKVKK